jgi:dienelactone hydrolase
VTERILVEPAAPALDTELHIRLTGFPPRSAVSVSAQMRDSLGRPHRSDAVFETGDDGSVDLSTAAPTGGTYEGVDPMGLIWSMRVAGEPDPAAGFNAAALPPASVTFSASGVARTVDRLRVPDGIERVVASGDGLVGTLFHPAGGGPHPGIILLGGAEGGLHELDAALLAGYGFAVLALAYFGAPGVPPELVNIPLEYFASAIAYLRGLEQVDGERLGIVGGSRGGEAALLVGATYPEIRAVVSTVGSGVMTQGIPIRRSFLEILETAAPSWTLGGQPLPYLPNVVPDELRKQVADGGPVELGLTFRAALENRDAVDRATIPVERINGPVLLVSTGDDRGWPSAELSEIAMRRLAGRRGRHVSYPDAGHPIAPPPYTPTTDLVMPGPGVMFASGGTPAANAHARADAWRQTVAFFTESLR